MKSDNSEIQVIEFAAKWVKSAIDIIWQREGNWQITAKVKLETAADNLAKPPIVVIAVKGRWHMLLSDIIESLYAAAKAAEKGEKAEALSCAANATTGISKIPILESG